MGQFLSYKNYSWDTHTGFPFLSGAKEVSLGGSNHIEQFLSYKNYSWDTHTGFPFLWGEKR
jgi:hypothetical protein